MATAEPSPTNKTPLLEPALTTDPAPTSTSTIRLVNSNATQTTSDHLPAPGASSSASPPSVTVTPASPTNQPSSSFDGPNPIDSSASSVPPTTQSPAKMKEKQPTDSETALVSNSTPASSVDKEKATNGDQHEPRTSSEKASAKPGPIQKLTRQLSGKASGKAATTTQGDAEKATPAVTTFTPRPSTQTTAPASTSIPAPAASTSQTTRSTGQPSTHKKKRKRKGLAGFLLALGCLSASEFEDEPKRTTEKPTAPAKPAGEGKKEVTSEKVADAGKPSATGVGAGGSSQGASTPAKVQNGAAAKGPAVSTPVRATDVVVAPVTPVSVPDDEVSRRPLSAGRTTVLTIHRPPASSQQQSNNLAQAPNSSLHPTEVRPIAISGWQIPRRQNRVVQRAMQKRQRRAEGTLTCRIPTCSVRRIVVERETSTRESTR